MEILVFGAGAVGGYLGGLLANAGNNVTLVVRNPAAGAIQHNGLTVRESEAQFVSRPQTVTSLRQAVLDDPQFDLVIVSVKAYDAEAALNELAAFYPAAPTIVTIQNGIGIEELFVEEFGPERVIAGSLTTPLSNETYHTVIVERSGRGLALAPTLAKQNISHWVKLFGKAGVTTVSLKKYRSMKWSKALFNMIGNATSAILNRHPKVIYSYGPTFDIEIEMLRETLAVMRKLKVGNVDLPGAPTGRLVFAVNRLPDSMVRSVVKPILTRIVTSGRGNKIPSFHLDLMAGKGKNEVVYHNGAVARAGAAVGVRTPVNAALNDILLQLANNEIDYEQFNGKPKQLVAAVKQYRRQSG